MAQMTQGQICGVGFDLAAEGVFWVESIEACRWLKKRRFTKTDLILHQKQRDANIANQRVFLDGFLHDLHHER
jgi:hypothetical protein